MSSPRKLCALRRGKVVTVSEELRQSSSSGTVQRPLSSQATARPFSSCASRESSPIVHVASHLVRQLDEDTLSAAPTNLSEPLAVRRLPYVANSVGGVQFSRPVVNGFERLDDAISGLVHRLPQSTLEDKFDVISQWIDSYHVDVVPHRVAAQLQAALDVVTDSEECARWRAH